MATATKAQVLQQPSQADFDKKFSYVLVQKNDDRGMVFDGNTGKELKGKEYKSRLNVLLRSSIVWDGSDAIYEDQKNPNSKLISGHRAGLQVIRYYDGCTSLFEDEQPKERETIERLQQGTREVFLLDGFLHVDGHEVMLRRYLDICSWNADSPFKIKRVQPLFMKASPEVAALRITESMDALEEAMKLAKKASDKKMLIHGQFLGVEMVDPKTAMEHPIDVIRTFYRKAAADNPKKFVETFNDESIQLEGFINKALTEGVISTSIIPNKAIWSESSAFICDIAGLKSDESVLNKLISFASSDEGAGFKEMLEKLNK